jgi:ribonuclease HII
LGRLHTIADSKMLTAAARETAYTEVMRLALGWHVVVIGPREIDARGLHVCNIAGMRRALAGLSCLPAYVLTDGFPVRGLGVPALAMWKGDEVAACVAAASVVAKVTRDRLMRELDARYPGYGFARHKGYSTPSHMRALAAYGPCPEHRRSFVNVSSRLAPGPLDGAGPPSLVEPGLGEPLGPGGPPPPAEPGPPEEMIMGLCPAFDPELPGAWRGESPGTECSPAGPEGYGAQR